MTPFEQFVARNGGGPAFREPGKTREAIIRAEIARLRERADQAARTAVQAAIRAAGRSREFQQSRLLHNATARERLATIVRAFEARELAKRRPQIDRLQRKLDRMLTSGRFTP